MEAVISSLTDIKISLNSTNVKIKTYYNDNDSLPNTILAFINNTPNYLFDYIPLKIAELGVKMINHPQFIDFNLNKSGELIVSGLDQDDIDNYSLGGTDNLDLVYTT